MNRNGIVYCITTLALGLGGCGGAGGAASSPVARPAPSAAPIAARPAPTATATAVVESAKASPPPVAQAFAQSAQELLFRDPDRRKKLEAAFPAIDAIAEEELKSQGLPSLAIGVVIDGELAHAKGFGLADLETKAAPDADTIYRIGSITKSFTAMTLLSLRDDGLLSFDDPLARWIPEAGALVYPTRDSPPITLRHMLTHTSGLPRLGTTLYTKPGYTATEDDIVKSLSGFTLENPPGTRHVYSNLAFGLLGIVAGRAAHMPYREAVNKRVLAPLGMTNTVWDRSSVPPGRMAAAYTKGPNGAPKTIPELWSFGAAEGMGGLYSSVRDMARYVAFQMAAYPPRDEPERGPIRRSSVREAHFNALRSGLRVRMREAPQKGESVVELDASRYGYGWVAQQTCALDDIIWHNGGTEGFRTEIAFLPEQGVGMVALINISSGSPETFVNRALLALQKSGGLSKRSPALSPAFEPVMKKFLDVYNTWDEAGYRAMLTPGRSVTMEEERVELETYKKHHGACKGFSPASVQSAKSAVLKMDCERGSLAMSITLADDGLITGFSGTSRDLPLPPDLAIVAKSVVGLVKKWDEAVYKKHLASAKPSKTRDQALRLFDGLRAAHGSCEVKSITRVVADEKIMLECDRGGDMTLTLSLDPKAKDSATAFGFESASRGTCPAR